MNTEKELLKDVQNTEITESIKVPENPEDITEEMIEEAEEEMENLEDSEDSFTSVKNGVAIYMEEARNYKLYTPEEELQAFKDLEAAKEANNEKEVRRIREEIFLHNMRLVVSVSKKYFKVNALIPPEDLVSEANFGMMTAIDRYDWHTGNRFSTYAYWWINQVCRRLPSNEGRIIRFPVHFDELNQKYNRFVEDFRLKNDGRLPTRRETIEGMNITDVQYNNIIIYNNMGTTASLDKVINLDNDSDDPLINFIEDKNAEKAFDAAINASFESDVIKLISERVPNKKSAERMIDVIKRRFGFDNHSPETLEQIAQSYGVTREPIRQIEMKAIKILRSPRAKRLMEEYR